MRLAPAPAPIMNRNPPTACAAAAPGVAAAMAHGAGGTHGKRPASGGAKGAVHASRAAGACTGPARQSKDWLPHSPLVPTRTFVMDSGWDGQRATGDAAEWGRGPVVSAFETVGRRHTTTITIRRPQSYDRSALCNACTRIVP